MKIISVFAVVLALVGALSVAPAYAAQNQHSFVSGLGNDANACTLAAPCRHLQAALAATIAGGEIAILDSAGYNGGTTVTINKAISIVNPGGFEAEISSPSGGAAILITAGTNDAVSLRGLSIDGAGVANTSGIELDSGAFLTIENCIVRHMTQDGIDFYSSNASSYFTVSNSIVSDNAGTGISFSPTGWSRAVFTHVETNNNGYYGNNTYYHGITVSGYYSAGTNTVRATVYDSVAAGNASVGYYTNTQSGNAPTTLMVFHSVAANNSYGVYAVGSGATVRVANSTLTGNYDGWSTDSIGVVDSYGDNYIDDNTSINTAPPSSVRK